MTIDYKALLTKYMRSVLEQEGVTFVDGHRFPDDVQFTPEEMAALKEVEDEVCA